MNFSLKNTNSILREFNTTGHRPLLILTDDFEKYVIKSGKGRELPIEILNEFICTYLLNMWNLPIAQPSVISLDPELIKSASLSNYQKKIILNQIVLAHHILKIQMI